MKKKLLLLSSLAAGIVIILSVTLFTAPFVSAEDDLSIPSNQTGPEVRLSENPEKVTTSPTQVSRRRSGEVEYPMFPRDRPRTTVPRTTVTSTPTAPPPTTVSPAPTISPTAVPPTPTASPPATVSATPTIPATTVSTPTVPPPTMPIPVVTVTVLVYQSGGVYRPVYYYPPYYPYPVNSYYPRGSITVNSNPSGATVILDGYNAERTPWVFTGLTTGYHTIEVTYPGYEAYVRNVYVDEGASEQVYADLRDLVSYGALVISSTPRGADVYVDGNYQGLSPVTVGGLAAGAHRVELHLAGYEVRVGTENVAPAQGTVVNYVLTPYSPSSEYGSVEITSDLPGALVYLDGIYKGSMLSGNTFSIIAVNPGTHTILLHVTGYADIIQTVDVKPGQITYVKAAFTSPPSGQQSPVPSSPATGLVIVTSTPSGGQVYLDNQFRGVAPVTIYNVASGTHIVNMKLPGYSDWSTSVTVPANQVIQVPATLIPGSETLPVTGRGLPLSPAAVIGALAIAVVLILYRFRR